MLLLKIEHDYISWVASGTVILLGIFLIYIFRPKKPTRADLITQCHQEYMQLQTEINSQTFIDVGAWEVLIQNFHNKWYGQVTENILDAYTKNLRKLKSIGNVEKVTLEQIYKENLDNETRN